MLLLVRMVRMGWMGMVGEMAQGLVQHIDKVLSNLKDVLLPVRMGGGGGAVGCGRLCRLWEDGEIVEVVGGRGSCGRLWEGRRLGKGCLTQPQGCAAAGEGGEFGRIGLACCCWSGWGGGRAGWTRRIQRRG